MRKRPQFLNPVIIGDDDGEGDGDIDADVTTYLGRAYFANVRDGMSRAVDHALRRGGRASLSRSSRRRHAPGHKAILARQIMLSASHAKRTAIASLAQASVTHLGHRFRGAKPFAGARLAAFARTI